MLVGRSAELDRIGALLDAARAGHAGALVLRGEPGIGKTALLEWAAERADGFHVLRAVGVESEAELPCAGLHQLLRPLLGRLDDLPAPQAAALRAALAIDTAASTERFAVYVGTLGLLAAAAEHEPLLCLIEDAHWLDTVSAEALVFSARRLEAESVAMLFAARTGERAFEASTIPELALARLDDDASVELLAHAGRRVPPATTAALLGLAAGNPLALLELPRDPSDPALFAAEAADQPLRLTGALDAAFSRRVRDLSDDARWALLLAAAAGPSGLGSSLHDETLGRALDEAATAGLVHVDGWTVSFRHPLIRSAAYYATGGADRRRAHDALAAAMPGGDADERAWHLAAAAAGPDDSTAELMVDVADRAGRRGAMGARARALVRAGELTADSTRRCGRLLLASRAAVAAGQSALALDLVDRADALANDPVTRADAAYARWDIQVEDWPTLYPSFVGAAEEVAQVDPHRAARLFSSASDYLFPSGYDESEEMVRRAWRLLGERLIPGSLGVASDMVWVRLADGETEAATDLAVAILTLAERTDDRDDYDDLSLSALALVFAEDERAGALVDRLVRRMRTRSVPGLTAAVATRASLDLRQGRLDAAYAAAHEAFALGDLLGGWQRRTAAAVLACVEGALGMRDDCLEHGDYTIEHSPADDRLGHAIVRGARGLAVLANGDPAAALDELETALTLCSPYHQDFPAVGWRTDLAEALIRVGEVEKADELLSSFERDRAQFPASMAAARRCRLLAAPDADLDVQATQALDAIAGRWPFEEARTLLVYGTRLRRAGRRIEARRQLERADDAFTRLGAHAWAEQARQELRASGATLRRRGPSAAEVLTPQELQVALHVVEGRTNREVGAALFISPKTVELHLSRVYRKLGIRSRTELARLHAAEPERLRPLRAEMAE